MENKTHLNFISLQAKNADNVLQVAIATYNIKSRILEFILVVGKGQEETFKHGFLITSLIGTENGTLLLK